jgi:hypothetical protein
VVVAFGGAGAEERAGRPAFVCRGSRNSFSQNNTVPVKRARREHVLIQMFLSAYENDSWRSANLQWVEEEQDNAVEVICTKADKISVAIEHTLIQLYAGEKADASRFEKYFSMVSACPSLVIPERHLNVFVPVRALVSGFSWEQIGEGLTQWLIFNHMSLPEGYSDHVAHFRLGTIVSELEIGIQISLHQGREGSCLVTPCDKIPWDITATVSKALRTKLPKLVENTETDKRVLLLERDRIHPAPSLIYEEILKQSSEFPLLEEIDEIWFVNTSFLPYAVHFELLNQRGPVETLSFRNGELTQRLVHATSR